MKLNKDKLANKIPKVGWYGIHHKLTDDSLAAYIRKNKTFTRAEITLLAARFIIQISNETVTEMVNRAFAKAKKKHQ